jgi:hypothetical protein
VSRSVILGAPRARNNLQVLMLTSGAEGKCDMLHALGVDKSYQVKVISIRTVTIQIRLTRSSPESHVHT